MENEVELCVEVGSNIGDTWVENADINQLCRSCANTHDNMIPIFEGDGLEHDLQNKIDKHFPVNISRDDGLPHQMCYQCASTLVAWHDMYMGCIDAENKLKNLLKKSTAKGQVEKTVAGSSIASAVSASVEPDSQQKMASEMEVDNDDNDDDDDDDVPEHGGDDNDDEEDDDDDNDDEDEEVEEIVLHKLEAKAKEKNVEVNEKGTTIRDQITVLRKDINEMQKFNFVLNVNGNDRTLEIFTNFSKRSDSEGDQIVIKKVVNHVRQKTGLKDEKLTVKVKFCHKMKENEDTKAKNLNSGTADYGYYCKECNLRYRHKHNFVVHMKTHEYENKSSGDEAHEDISEGTTHAYHLKKTNSKNSDGEKHKNMSDGKAHAKSSKKPKKCKSEKKYHCAICNKQLTSGGGYYYHMKHFHRGVKKHACDICGRRFSQKTFLAEHKRIHTGERPFICQVCGKAFRTSAILFIHLKSHSNEHPYSCPICDKKFKYRHAFRNHQAVHSERVREKNYLCDFCGKTFCGSSQRKRHMMIHNGLKPYPCPICDSMFNQKRYLKQHLLGKHDMESNAACTLLQKITPLLRCD